MSIFPCPTFSPSASSHNVPYPRYLKPISSSFLLIFKPLLKVLATLLPNFGFLHSTISYSSTSLSNNPPLVVLSFLQLSITESLNREGNTWTLPLEVLTRGGREISTPRLATLPES
ncbi:hypothetical protein EUGRSUZ_A01464 [Eucalyptus grandis]|uniref:Uncharacterized protein n=2 Tax=Eucalyptus grandis TaxID=71139 RepID=A0ACC3M3A5_EUCGR|nr:hypothetical protein EUGRSUZ_A01464 [Eucalyptus grandis]